ncbi:copper resistance CopC family protein [Actinoplanes sp. N902-109]|uniref:copper resistance CopC family protein n=1 Tax=Actinoplanes sp. (strain N902-109) TaxID=649831 RepID=UPI00032959D6|nr:copper resistance CopC family protein [Actinoplanes sp. N902-109]AGL14136.1 copper resistance protein CopC [Actinoplanes sp. N902-109]
MRRVSTVLAASVAALVLLLPGTPAWAHNVLISSSPARDATLATAPDAITLVFAQKLNPDFTTVVLSDAARQRVPASVPEVADTKATITPSGTLGGGAYTVAYRVVSVDGHTVQGSYSFTVSGPAASAPPQKPVEPAASDDPAGGVSSATLLAIGAAAVMVLLIGAVVLLRGRRRR